MGWMLDFEGTRFFSIFIPLSFSFSFSVFVYPSHTSLVKENAGWPGCVSFFGPCTNVSSWGLHTERFLFCSVWEHPWYITWQWSRLSWCAALVKAAFRGLWKRKNRTHSLCGMTCWRTRNVVPYYYLYDIREVYPPSISLSAVLYHWLHSASLIRRNDLSDLLGSTVLGRKSAHSWDLHFYGDLLWESK